MGIPDSIHHIIEDIDNQRSVATLSWKAGNSAEPTANVSEPGKEETTIISKDVPGSTIKTIKSTKTEKALAKPTKATGKKAPAKAATSTSKTVRTIPAKKTTDKKTTAKKPRVEKKKPDKKSQPSANRDNAMTETEKPLSDDYVKMARFSKLLETFINSANELQDEFGGIPDQIQIVADRFNRCHGRCHNTMLS
jgi:hypothetical protein